MTLLDQRTICISAVSTRETDWVAFVPISPCPPSLTPNKIYREKEFREALPPDARKQLEGPRDGNSK